MTEPHRVEHHKIAKRETVTLSVRIPIALYNAMVDYANTTHRSLAAVATEWLGSRLANQRGEVPKEYQ